MSAAGISNATASLYQSTNPQPGFRYYMKNLNKALQSGNLQAAQQAYSSLSQLPQFQTALANPSSSTNGTLVQALAQIGADLQSGDLSSAQQAFSALRQQSPGAQAGVGAVGGHHHHAADGDADDASSTSGTSSTGQLLAALNGTNSTSSSTDPLLAMLLNGTNGSGGTTPLSISNATITSLINILT